MKITGIKKLKNGRYAVFADGNYMLSSDGETLGLSGIVCGDEVSGEEFSAFSDAVEKKTAGEKALDLLSFRDHSKSELEAKLLKRKIGREAARGAVARMEELGLVNDGEYAQRYARELLYTRFFGARRAVYELRRRGIPEDTALRAVEELDKDPRRRAFLFLKKKYPRGLADEKDRRRAAAALSRRGYSWEEIRAAVSLYDGERDD